MRRLLPLLGAVLALAVLSSTAAADTFRVAHHHRGGATRSTAFAPNGAVIRFTAGQNGPMSFANLRGIWQAAGTTYGIPWEVLAAINKVETDFGRNLGPSSAGAIGWMQFMPSTWARWGEDANGDGIADPDNPTDAIFSAARYLAGCGGQFDIAGAVYCYNHADWYVSEVLGLASMYGRGGGAGLFSVDQVQTQLASARKQVAASSSQLAAAGKQTRKLAHAQRRYLRTAASAPLLSDQLEAHKHAVLLGVRHDAAVARLSRLRKLLRRANMQLERAQQQANGAFSSAPQLVSAPVSAGSYVFPVGGGPGEVSVGTTHHDYPAADIDAPEGSPVYALASARVDDSWATPDGNCGIGAKITTSDGQSWTYCHLSFLDPTVRPGAELAAGASMGLVGQTGDATGPHLHLQLDPTDAYPQDETWFRGFAGLAFSWQNGAPTRGLVGATAQPLFSVLAQPSVQFSSAGAGSGTTSFTSNVVYFTR